VLQDWLGQADILQRAIDVAGVHGQVTVEQLHRSAEVLTVGTVGAFEIAERDASPAAARRLAAAAANVAADRSSGVYEVVVLDRSSERARRLADGLAQALGTRMRVIAERSLNDLIARVRRGVARAEAIVAQERQAVSKIPHVKASQDDDVALAHYRASVAVLSDLQAKLTSLEALQLIGSSDIVLLVPAGPPAAPATPGRGLYLLMGLFVGVVAGVAAILIREGVRGAGT